MPTPNENETRINEQQQLIEDLRTELDAAKALLEVHAHQGDGTKNIQDIIKLASYIDVNALLTEGVSGLSGVLTVRNAADDGTCTITVSNGIITATTC